MISFLNNSYSMERDYDNYISSIQNYLQATINAVPRSDIYIYMDNPTIPMSMDVFYHLSDISGETPIAEFLESGRMEQWFCESNFIGISNPYLFSTEKCFVYLRKAYDFRKNFLGLIVFSIPEKYFLSFENESSETVISSGNNRIVNLSGDTLTADTLTQIEISDKPQSQINGYLVTLNRPKDFPVSVITVTKNSNIGQLVGIFLLILGLFAILSIFLCLRSLRQLDFQMNQCLTAMEVFSSKMKLYGHYEESDCLVAFANIFRYNISTNDALVEVRVELAQLHNYLRIQQLRYPQLIFHSDIPEELMTAQVSLLINYQN